jgi:dolichol-phosphate mannosyltransferase
VLFGTARAYPQRPWTYWLSPLLDLPVVLRLIQRGLQRRHSWRGRRYVDVGDGRFVLESAQRELET